MKDMYLDFGGDQWNWLHSRMARASWRRTTFS